MLWKSIHCLKAAQVHIQGLLDKSICPFSVTSLPDEPIKLGRSSSLTLLMRPLKLNPTGWAGKDDGGGYGTIAKLENWLEET
mmetsp:Transcript_34538/g.55129  ORF Transcript_34538/g.55129 Transcript_34538/m.55129 type:complete len:82 (+) Transcript_34538:5547-5792(+)